MLGHKLHRFADGDVRTHLDRIAGHDMADESDLRTERGGQQADGGVAVGEEADGRTGLDDDEGTDTPLVHRRDRGEHGRRWCGRVYGVALARENTTNSIVHVDLLRRELCKSWCSRSGPLSCGERSR